jgi:hypothetical protein
MPRSTLEEPREPDFPAGKNGPVLGILIGRNADGHDLPLLRSVSISLQPCSQLSALLPTADLLEWRADRASEIAFHGQDATSRRTESRNRKMASDVPRDHFILAQRISASADLLAGVMLD